MRNGRIKAVFLLLFLLAVFAALNIELTTRQGIDYKVYTLKIPFYLKALDFYDRHYNYKWLVKRVTEGESGAEGEVMALFKWTAENIVKQPAGLRAVDDHVWHIIVRGYGTRDQFSDVFTTLCNYAGADAFFERLLNRDGVSKMPFSFVKIGKRWRVFDPYNGVYFTAKDGSIASVEDISQGNWRAQSLGENFCKSKLNYEEYFGGILAIDFEKSHRWARANIQSPINRFFYGLLKRDSYALPLHP